MPASVHFNFFSKKLKFLPVFFLIWGIFTINQPVANAQEAQPAPDITRSRAVLTIGGEQVKVSYASVSAEDMKGDRKREKAERYSEGGGGERFKGSNRGPSEEDRKRYESLSDKARDKFRDMMRSKFSDEKFRNAPEEERRNIIRKEFERIEKEDKGGKK